MKDQDTWQAEYRGLEAQRKSAAENGEPTRAAELMVAKEQLLAEMPMDIAQLVDPDTCARIVG